MADKIDGRFQTLSHFAKCPSTTKRRFMVQEVFSVPYQGEVSQPFLHWVVAEVNMKLLIRQRKQIMEIHTFAVASQKVVYFSTVAGCAFSPGCDNLNYFLYKSKLIFLVLNIYFYTFEALLFLVFTVFRWKLSATKRSMLIFRYDFVYPFFFINKK